MAGELGRKPPFEEWEKSRDEIRHTIETKGYDRSRGIFTQAFGRDTMDAALLLLPISEFVEYKDERMVRTVSAIRKDLETDGLLLRYPSGDDGMDKGEMKKGEGFFLACSFWLTECLACQGKISEAKKAFRKALSTGNDLGLFSEEYDAGSRQMLGNYPQGLTHLSIECYF